MIAYFPWENKRAQFVILLANMLQSVVDEAKMAKPSFYITPGLVIESFWSSLDQDTQTWSKLEI